MKTILIHSIQDEFSTVAWQRANYREMSHIYECMESSNIPFKTSQIIAPLRGGAETSKQHNETMKRWSGEVMKPWRNNETAKKTNDEKPMWSIVGWVRWSVVLCWSKVLITCAYCCRGELYQLFLWWLSDDLVCSVNTSCHRQASNLALKYLCKLAGCTFNIQLANLHHFFFSAQSSSCDSKHTNPRIPFTNLHFVNLSVR